MKVGVYYRLDPVKGLWDRIQSNTIKYNEKKNTFEYFEIRGKIAIWLVS